MERSWVGRRVTVRRVVERRGDGQLLFGDVVGDLVGLDAQTAVVEARDGIVEVPLALIAAAKPAPPSTADELALEAVAARGLRPLEEEEIGGWLLRADHGFTRRANSVLPLRQPGVPLDELLAAVHTWYAARGLPVRIAIPTEARRLLDAALGERGWGFEVESHLMASRLDLLAAAPNEAEVTLASEPDDDWLSLYRGGEGAAATGRALLVRHDRVVFASVRDGARTVAIGRGALDNGWRGDDVWLGLAGVEVAADARRRGLATAVTGALHDWGRGQGATRGYLQVETGNATAVALYEKLGYWVHHDYRYRYEPGGDEP